MPLLAIRFLAFMAIVGSVPMAEMGVIETVVRDRADPSA
jgi:hypothetical protein